MGQYEAGVHAQNILRKVMNRSDMGSVVNEANDRWTNGRKRIGSYNMGLLENVDYNDPENDYKFELGFNSFINKLNEHYHVDGYYIDSDGKTSGNIYVCEECDDGEVYMINGMNDDVAYIQQEAAWQDYLVNKARLENRLKIAVSEALVLSDERIVNKVDSLISLQEGIGDSLSNAWTKFKNFIAKLWQKFTEFISRTLNNDKGYLTKYKEIILNRDVTIDSVTIDNDYTQGEKNITQFVIYTPSSADINSFPSKNEGDNIKRIQDKLFPPYQGNHALDFPEYCVKYFKGNRDEVTLTSEQIKTMLPSMFNWCYNFDKIEKKINRDRGTYDKAFRAFETVAKDTDAKAKAVKNAQLRADTSNSDVMKGTGDIYNSEAEATNAVNNATKERDTAKTDRDAKKQDWEGHKDDASKKTAYDTAENTLKEKERNLQATLQKKQRTMNHLANVKTAESSKNLNVNNKNAEQQQESAIFMTTLGIPITEADVVFGSNKSAVGNKAVGTASKAGNLNLSNSAVRTRDAGDTGALVDNSNEEDLNNKFAMFCTSSQQIFAALLQSAQTINKNYMTIIKRHVQSYAGNMEDSTKTAAGVAANYTLSFRLNPTAVATLTNSLVEVRKLSEDDEEKRNIKQQAIYNLLQRANEATKDDQGNIRKTFTSLDELENFLKAHNEPKPEQVGTASDNTEKGS